jgi:hypothetical protein
MLAGFLGGILAASLLRYPTLTVFPTPFVSGWEGGDLRLAWAAVAGAAFVVVLAGMVAARIGGSEGRLGGACSGSAAGLLAGSLAAGPAAGAAGVYGSRMLLTRSLVPAASNAEFLTLLSESVVQTIFWTFLSAWLMVLTGILLGALGGVLVGGKRSHDASPVAAYYEVWVNTAIAGMLVSLFAYLVAGAVFALLATQVAKASTDVAHTLSLPAWTSSTIPVLTSLAFFLLFQITGWVVLTRVVATVGQPAWAGRARYIAAGMPFLLVSGMFFLARDRLFQPWIAAGRVLICLGGLLTFFIKKQPANPDKPLLRISNIASFGWTGFLSTAALVLIALITSTASLNTVMLIIPQIVMLDPASAGSADISFTMRSLVLEDFTVQGVFNNVATWAIAVGGLAGAGLGWLIDLWQTRRKSLA